MQAQRNKSSVPQVQWIGKWIWINYEENPKNEYVYARKKFHVVKSNVQKAEIKITADSKYVLFVNGTRIGIGPIRSWPFELSYDCYDITNYLVDGENVVAVLVQHYGISTFQYILGRAGLLVQIEIRNKDKSLEIIGTDSSWKMKVSKMYVRNVPRISCQQAWVEEVDPREDFNWFLKEFDDLSWENAKVIGEVGMVPWKSLIQREIPFLTKVQIPPKRIMGIRNVRAPKISWYIDLRNNLLTGKLDANPKGFKAFLATVISSNTEQSIKLRFVHPRWVSPQGEVKVNGVSCERKNDEYILNIKRGENLVLINVSGQYHDWGVSVIFEVESEVNFRAPLLKEYPWATIGPFEEKGDEEFTYAWGCKTEEELLKVKQFLKEVKELDFSDHQVYAMTSCRVVVNEEVQIENEEALMSLSEEFAVIKPTGEDIELILDFGEEVFGYISFEVETSKDTILDWNFFETINENHEPKFTEGLNNVLRYVTKEGFQGYKSIVKRGFRYATLTIRKLDKPIRIRKIYCELSTFPVIQRGNFVSSDEVLNQIWRMCERTLKLCMDDTYMDCPTYEQTLWVGDARVEALVNYYVFGDTKLTKRSLLLAAKSLYRSSLPESQVPSGWQNILSTWSLLWILAVEEYFSYTKDKNFLKEIYPYVVTTLNNLKNFLNKESLLSIEAWNMLDWAPMDTPNKGIVTHLNILTVEAYRRGAKLANILDDYSNAEKFLELSNTIRSAVTSKLWDEDNGGFIDSIHEDGSRSKTISVVTNALAVSYDCVTEEQMGILKKKLLDFPEDWVKPGSPYGMFFVLEALMKLGYHEKVVKEIKENWSYMLHSGPGTCWETFKTTRSYCHGWSSGPLYFLSKLFTGVDILQLKDDKLLVEPKCLELSNVRGEIPSSYGRIAIAWNKEGDSFRFYIRIPKMIQTKVVLPAEVSTFNVVSFEDGDFLIYVENKRWILEAHGPCEAKIVLSKS
ncbi:MAG: alpha-L-rhamnosidase N-terminal domain-containing protein [Thermoproteota archaeon]|nr:alpha-L-rhamnosidase N-terminal domain-containing protein [Candidatus Brockarchaeota archaeon]